MHAAQALRERLRGLAAVGPGLLVMLADTDAGSAITAAQSGARWGYDLLVLQLVLIPVLFLVQDLTVRLGLVTGRGHGELILHHFGRGWAWLSVSTMAVACVGALVTQLSGLAGVGMLFGVPPPISVTLGVGFVVAMVWSARYRLVERVAIGLGLFELAFVWIAWHARPSTAAILEGLARVPLGDASYRYLAAANVGAVIMPWMIFYQQSAECEKGLTPESLTTARRETAIGAVLTQAIMIAILVATAATIGRRRPGAPLESVQQISEALVPLLGTGLGRVVFALGMSGSALVATIVVSLTVAWGVGEVAGYERSLTDRPRQAPWFYAIFTGCLVLAGVVVASGVDLVELSVAMEVLNALLLPIVLGFLYLLARRALPDPYRLTGTRAAVTFGVMFVVTAFGVFTGITGIVGR